MGNGRRGLEGGKWEGGLAARGFGKEKSARY